MNAAVIFFLAAFAVKHALIDVAFQLAGMPSNVAKRSADAGLWIPAMLTHVFFHGLCTAVILMPSTVVPGAASWSAAVGLTALDMTAHFIMDKLKIEKLRAIDNLPAEYYVVAMRKRAAWLVGDQVFHVATYLVIIYLVMR